MKDKIVIICTEDRFTSSWEKRLQKMAPEIPIEIYPNDTNREETQFVLTFNPPKDAFTHYPNLKVIASMAAGVDAILSCDGISDDIIITKVNDQMHHEDMAFFALTLVANQLRNISDFEQQKLKKDWHPHRYRRPQEVTVGIMGLGSIGMEIAQLFLKNRFHVSGWSHSEKHAENIQTFYGDDQRDAFLATADFLICVLPLTDKTQGILNRETFAQLPDGAFVINLGRGRHLVENDLTEAIASGKLSGAALDVFATEPLPINHPFWTNEKIIVTPHTAGTTNPVSTVQKVLDNYAAFKLGNPLEDVIDKKKGY